MQEREYFRDLCLDVLSSDGNVRFAGVVDDTGKLLVGEYRKDIDSPLVKASSFIGDPRIDGPVSTFDASLRGFSLNKSFESDLGNISYQLTVYSKVKLLTVVLTDKESRYLCVSIDPGSDCQTVIEKVLKSI